MSFRKTQCEEYGHYCPNCDNSFPPRKRADEYEAELVHLREQLQQHTQIISNLATALCPNSPKESAEAEFALDAMGACQIIRRNRERVTILEADMRAIAEGKKRLVMCGCNGCLTNDCKHFGAECSVLDYTLCHIGRTIYND